MLENPCYVDVLEQFAMVEFTITPHEIRANIIRNYTKRLLSKRLQDGLWIIRWLMVLSFGFFFFQLSASVKNIYQILWSFCHFSFSYSVLLMLVISLGKVKGFV